MKSFNEWLKSKNLNENSSADGWNFNEKESISTQKVGESEIKLVPINFGQHPSYGERSSDFGLLVKNPHGVGKAYLSPNKSIAQQHYMKFVGVANQYANNPDFHKMITSDLLDELLGKLGVR